MKIEEKFVETKFGKINYLEIGQGKKYLLVIHGGFGTPELINGLTNGLLTLEYKIIAPFLPGHGGSFKIPHGFRFEDMVSIIKNLVDRLSINKTDIIGHSLGGGIAAALSSEKFVNKIVLIDPVLDGEKLKLPGVAWDLIYNAVADRAVVSSLFPTLDGIKLKTPNFLETANILRIVREIKIENSSKSGEDVLICWGHTDKIVSFLKQKPVLVRLGWNNIKFFPGGHYWYKYGQKNLFSAIKEFV